MERQIKRVILVKSVDIYSGGQHGHVQEGVSVGSVLFCFIESIVGGMGPGDSSLRDC